MTIPLTKVCEPEDFADPTFMSIRREVLPHELERHGPAWPAGRGYRKD